MRRTVRDLIATTIVAALRERTRVADLRRLAQAAATGDAWETRTPALRAPEAGRERAVAARRLERGLAVVERYWREGGAGGSALETALVQAALLLEAGLFFETHEVLEDAWRGLEGPARRFVQGVIQVAVALHHLERGNAAGARRLFAAARVKLAAFPACYQGVAVDELLASLEPWEAVAAAGAPWPVVRALPVLRVRRV